MMSIFKFCFLFLFLFHNLVESRLNYNIPQAFFYPNFNNSARFLSAGTAIMPLCANPLNSWCINQWSQQAIPLEQNTGSFFDSKYQYFMPSFLPSQVIDDDEDWEYSKDEEWDVYIPPYNSKTTTSQKKSKTHDRKKSRNKKSTDKQEPEIKIYTHKEKPSIVRIEQESKGSIIVTEGEMLYVPISAIKKTTTPQKISKTKKTKKTKDQKQKTSKTKKTKLVKPSKLTSKSQATTSYIISQDTPSIPATIAKKPKQKSKASCVTLDKKQEANYCFDCKNKPNSVLTALQKRDGNFQNKIDEQLEKIESEAQTKINGKLKFKINNKGQQILQICHPERSLKQIISNFEKTCSNPFNDFKEFSKQAQCESCKKNIPPEIMLAMMSIESAGRCSAINSNRHETSIGLFQIDATQHQCCSFKKKTNQNKKCFKNVKNNLNKALDVLLMSYAGANPTGVKKECKTWTSMTSKERDSWRRAVSGYNGGSGWISRAIFAAKDKRTEKNLSHLVGSQANYKIRKKYKKIPVNWEELRSYYFIEAFHPNNTGQTGRNLEFTLSNLAHTEAILGRESKTDYVGMVEIWSEYIRQNKIKTCENQTQSQSCSK